jgi:hypothetical protein
MPFAPTIEPDADLTKVRGHLSDAAKYCLELRSRPKDKQDANYAEDVRSAIDFINEFDPIERALTAAGRPVEVVTESRGGRGNGADLGDNEFRSIGRQVTEGKGFEEWVTSGRRGAYVVETRNLVGEFPSGNQFATGANLLMPVGSPFLQSGTLQRRRMFVRDLVTVQPTGLSDIPYLRELNAATDETGALMVSEGSAKPEVALEFQAADAPVRKIAAWLPVTDEIMSDAPTLRGYIDSRLEYMLMIREEAQELNGNGTPPNLTGITATAGIQTRAAVAGDLPATIGLAIALVENVDGEADGVALNPLDFWTAVTKRYTTSFDNAGTGNAPNAQAGITWGLPAVRTRALLTTKAIVAAWKLGATIFDREQTTIKVGDQHNDNFIKNILIVLGEKRVAFAVWRPALFVDTTVPNT